MTKKSYGIETSLTLDYRKEAWGLERIAVDGISNHLPEDSGGTSVKVQLKQDGQYKDLKDADPNAETEEIVFEDDGRGYDAGILSVLFSSKGGNARSVGQFGEGAKLIASAALRHGIKLEYSSRNWKAIPYAKKETIDGSDLERLCFNIEENGQSPEGSKTRFMNPPQEFVREVCTIPSKVLALNDEYTEIYNEKDAVKIPWHIDLKSYNSRIIDTGENPKSIFVNGVRVQKSDSIFSYDFGLDFLSPDRSSINHEGLMSKMRSLLENCSDQKVIEEILKRANEDGAYFDEFRAFASDLTVGDESIIKGKSPSTDFERSESTVFLEKIKKIYSLNPTWANSFRNLFGEKAVIADYNGDVNKDVEAMGYDPVRMNSHISGHLRSLGVKSAGDIKVDLEYKWVEPNKLTDPETEMLKRANEINSVVLEEPTSVDIRVYEGLFNQTGREIDCALGVYLKEPEKEGFIGVKRSQLERLSDFTHTYLHELGHHVTGADDYSRPFTDFFVRALAKITTHYLEQKGEK